jgi:tetratricopeptide (TPR) repeat protein
MLAWVYAKQGEYEKAAQACDEAVRREPYSAPIYYGLGRIYAVIGNSQKALEQYKRALEIKPDLAEARLFSGMIHADSGQHQQAIQEYQQAIRLDRYYAEPHFFLGLLHDQLGQCREAVEALETGIQSYRLYSQNQDRLGAIGIEPDLAQVYTTIGACYLRLGKYYEAGVAFQDATKSNMNHAGAHFGLGIAYLLESKKDKALEQYQILKGVDEDLARQFYALIKQD